jgi:hypothetical protein
VGVVVSEDAKQPASAEDVLRRPVHTESGNKAFGELTVADVEARAGELRAATGWGPTAKIASVARAWSELARAMKHAGAATVGELEPEDASARARALWVVPPRGSLL